MPEFRFEGTNVTGRVVRGVISAETMSDARRKISDLSNRHHVKVSKILKRRTFIYKVRRDGMITKGEQRAFTKDEVSTALKNLGYEVQDIQLKVLDFKLKPPTSEVVTFVRVSADMLREKLSFGDVLQLLIEDTQNATLREALKEINVDLRQGKDSEEAFTKQEKVLGRFTSRMLGLAAKSGNMADIYESTAKFLERNADFKRNLRSALITPFFTILALLAATLFYVMYIFPETAVLFERLGATIPPMTAWVLSASRWLTANVWWILTLFIGSMVLTGGFLSTVRGRFLRDKYVLKIPVLGSLIHKTAIEIFCRVFYALYSGSGENIDAIRLASEACGNSYMEHQIKTVSIPMMLSQGRGVVSAFEASGVFTRTALARFHSGSETGTIKNTALQVANYYEKETVYRLKNTI
nr:type II secretion system F family protein [Calditrichia bacterium]